MRKNSKIAVAAGALMLVVLVLMTTGVVLTQTRGGSGDERSTAAGSVKLETEAAPPEPSTAPSSVSPSLGPSVGPSTGPSISPSTGPSVSLSAAPTASPMPSVPPTTSPSDRPSATPTVAPSFQPSDAPSGSPSASPSTTPSAPPSTAPSASFQPSASPTNSPTAHPTRGPGPPLQYVERGAGTEDDDDMLLQQCQGDCDDDDDNCAGNLECHRPRRDYVPGCEGSLEEMGATHGDDAEDADYCVDPNDLPEGGDLGPTRDSFRLKMYWEKGYKWQEERRERKYCMERSGSSLVVANCDSRNTFFEFHRMANATHIRVAGRDDDDSRCFEIVGNNRMELRECRAGRERQQFVALRGAFRGEGRFEIGTVYRPGGCLSQQHHPRPGEVIKRVECRTARDDDTSFWLRY